MREQEDKTRGITVLGFMKRSIAKRRVHSVDDIYYVTHAYSLPTTVSEVVERSCCATSALEEKRDLYISHGVGF